MTSGSLKVCKSCTTKPLPLDRFSVRTKDSTLGKKGELADVCVECMTKDRERKRKKRAEQRAESGISERAHKPWVTDITVEAFMDMAAAAVEKDVEFRVEVDIDELVSLDNIPEKRVRLLAVKLNEVMRLHWSLSVHHARKDHTEWIFCCTQAKNRGKKGVSASERKRATKKMDRGHCEGWLRILTINSDSRMKISIIWLHVVEEERKRGNEKSELPYRQKAVYYYWHKQRELLSTSSGDRPSGSASPGPGEIMDAGPSSSHAMVSEIRKTESERESILPDSNFLHSPNMAFPVYQDVAESTSPEPIFKAIARPSCHNPQAAPYIPHPPPPDALPLQFAIEAPTVEPLNASTVFDEVTRAIESALAILDSYGPDNIDPGLLARIEAAFRPGLDFVKQFMRSEDR
ncbi:hypothetical protein BU17DRAFT_68853 [Hysterangium stoloniferum]|nr:hypothetical protein BU17DRAFT_68853 [Hysterangium stoloniferum]